MSAAKSWDLAWAACVLEGLPNVELHGFTVDTDVLSYLNPTRCTIEPFTVVTVTIQAAGMDAARLLVEALRLSESGTAVLHDDCFGLTASHTWTGWAAEASAEVPVRVEVTASERLWNTEGVAA